MNTISNNGQELAVGDKVYFMEYGRLRWQEYRKDCVIIGVNEKRNWFIVEETVRFSPDDIRKFQYNKMAKSLTKID